jgi:four helix bundle protein
MQKFGFEELLVWQKARVLKLEINKIIKDFPKEETYKLIDQLKRSSRSIGALIAKGHGRFTYPDQIHFCVQARGSLMETFHQFNRCIRRGIYRRSNTKLKYILNQNFMVLCRLILCQTNEYWSATKIKSV